MIVKIIGMSFFLVELVGIMEKMLEESKERRDIDRFYIEEEDRRDREEQRQRTYYNFYNNRIPTPRGYKYREI